MKCSTPTEKTSACDTVRYLDIRPKTKSVKTLFHQAGALQTKHASAYYALHNMSPTHCWVQHQDNPTTGANDGTAHACSTTAAIPPILLKRPQPSNKLPSRNATRLAFYRTNRKATNPHCAASHDLWHMDSRTYSTRAQCFDPVQSR